MLGRGDAVPPVNGRGPMGLSVLSSAARDRDVNFIPGGAAY